MQQNLKGHPKPNMPTARTQQILVNLLEDDPLCFFGTERQLHGLILPRTLIWHGAERCVQVAHKAQWPLMPNHSNLCK